MKKSRVLLTAFAVALSLGSVSVEAKSAKERLKDDYKTLQNCLKGKKCSRAEALRAARNLGVAAVAAVGAAVVASKVAGKGLERAESLKSKNNASARYAVATTAKWTGKQMQRPYDATRGTIGRGAAAFRGAGIRATGWRRPGTGKNYSGRGPVGPTMDLP